NQIPGVNVPVPDAHHLTTNTTAGWTMQQIGAGVGMLLPFKLAEAIRPLAFGSKLAGTSKAIADGAFSGARFTSSEYPSHSMLCQGSVAAATRGVAFGTQHGLAKWSVAKLGIAPTVPLENPWGNIGARLGVNAFTGGVAGGLSTQTHPLLSRGEFASA